MVFFLLHLFALKNSILRSVYRLHQKGSRSTSQKTGRTLPLRSKRKKKAEILLIKFPNLTILLLAKKQLLPYEYSKAQFKNRFQGNDSEHNLQTEPLLCGQPMVSQTLHLRGARGLNPGAGRITFQKAIEEPHFLSKDDYFEWYWGWETSTKFKWATKEHKDTSPHNPFSFLHKKHVQVKKPPALPFLQS